MDSARQDYLNHLALAIIGIATAAYGWLIWTHALNIPYKDDILDVLRFLQVARDSNTGAQWFSALMAQHNDHRTAASRLAYLSFAQLQGEIDFRTLTLAINLVSLGFLGFFASQLRRELPRRALLCVPLALVLMQPAAWALLSYTMAIFAMYGVYLYAFASFWLLQKLTPTRLAFAVAFAALSTFSLASGQLVWLVGAVAIGCTVRLSTPLRLAYLLPWLLAGTLALVLFQWGQQSPNTPSHVVSLAFATPLKHSLYFLGLLGSTLSLGNLAVATALGTAIGLLLVYLTLQGGTRTAVVYSAWFCVLSCAAMTLGRAPYSLAEAAIGSRFSVPSQLLVCATWVMLANRGFNGRGINSRVALATCLAAGLLCLGSYRLYLPQFDQLREERLKAFSAGNWRTFGYPPKMTRGIVNRAIREDLYRPPTNGPTDSIRSP